MTLATSNPLVQPWNSPFGLPPFADVLPEHFKPAFEQALTEHLAEVEAIAASTEPPSFDNTIAALDRTNKEAVEAYVAKAQAHDKLIDSYEAQVPSFNAKVEALQAERAAYAKTCEGRRYLEDDYKDIKAGK